jgi:response regulator RpfG family c-di-GMP phosphodiesterase
MSQQTDDDEGWLEEESSDAEITTKGANKWRILIVDDELDVHAVTRLALKNISFKDQDIEIVSAYSGQEGFDVLASDSDICMVLLDVVMETENAGLVLAQRIRQDLKNDLVRIILRTGQPGQAPEQKIIVDYDINDYKLKTELTAQKMFTCVISSLRAYEGLKTIEASRRGLDKILQAVNNLYQLESLKELATGVLTQISAILNFGTEGVLCVMRSANAGEQASPTVIATIGQSVTLQEEDLLPESHPWTPAILKVFHEKKNLFSPIVDVFSIIAAHGQQFAVAFAPARPLTPLECNLLDIFCDRIAAAFDNLQMFELLKTTQEATVIALADLAESRDATTGGHVRRVCRLTEAIARELNLLGKLPPNTHPNFLAFVGIASILHDVGKVGIPDAILLKPGQHTPEERVIMQGHALIGETVLAHASASVPGVSSLSIGAEIAGGHHEHFDGNGYPRGLKGENIPLSARIVAVVDVFDALLHSRPYKKPWPLPEVMTYVTERSGTQFDPDVIEALLNFLDKEKPDWIIAEGH